MTKTPAAGRLRQWVPLCVRLFLTTAVLGMALVRSASSQDYSQEEFRSLPRVCLAQKFISAALRAPVVSELEREDWARRLGPSYEHYHHFCWALIDMRRANEPGRRQERQSHYIRALSNFDYVLKNSAPSFPLLPEVFLRKGMTLRQVGDDVKAAKAFLDAIEVKRNYTPAYAAVADVYADLEDFDSAVKMLELGLSVVPDSKILASKKIEIELRLTARR